MTYNINTGSSLPAKDKARQTMRDKQEMMKRIKRWSSMFSQIKDGYFKGKRKSWMLEQANGIVARTGYKSPDRLCKRQRDALICWFCEVIIMLNESRSPIQTADDSAVAVDQDGSSQESFSFVFSDDMEMYLPASDWDEFR
jgi:hypothetical protein